MSRMNFSKTVFLTCTCWLSIVFSEWLFLVTKVSFLSTLGAFQKLSVLVVSSLPLIAIHLTLVALSVLVARYVAPKTSQFFGWVHALLLSFLFCCLILLLVENFTYTVFSFNMSYASGVVRLAYTIPFLVFCTLLTIKIRSMVNSETVPADKVRLRVSMGILFVAMFFLSPMLSNRGTGLDVQKTEVSEEIKRPNIVLFIADSVVADNTSLYGYERETTPNLKRLGEEGLVAWNFFSNASHTTGALGAFYTGKLPTDTRLMYRPDILKGVDSYQHLPGILSRLGYHCIDASLRYFADPDDLNLKNGFHVANGRSIRFDDEGLPGTFSAHFPLESYFINSVYKRVEERVAHMFALKNMANVYDAVAFQDTPWSKRVRNLLADNQRLEYVAEEIVKTPGPFFAHVHVMNTHGPMYWPKYRNWSLGKRQTEGFMTDFYDDVIRETDSLMKRLINILESSGRFENTIFIYASDHGDGWTAEKRLPLVIRFPNAEIRRELNHNAQLIDLAPSILDYMGIEKPDWMDGESLLSVDDSRHRPIFLTGAKQPTGSGPSSMTIADYSEPFYSMGYLSVVIANRIYNLNLLTNDLTVKELEGHTAPLPESEFPELEDIREKLISHLRSKDYDVSTLVSH